MQGADHPPAIPFSKCLIKDPFLASLSFCFLGVALYRTWIEVVVFGHAALHVGIDPSRDMLFDFSKTCALTVCFLLAKKISPLCYRRSAFMTPAILFVVSTLGVFVSSLYPSHASWLAIPSIVLSGVAMGVIMLMWAELYSCLTPLKVTVLFAASQILAALLTFLFRGFYLPWLSLATPLLPIVSLAMLLASYRQIDASELPQVAPAAPRIPWKLILLTSLFGFTFGLKEFSLDSSAFCSGAYSSPGTIAISAIVLAGALRFRERFELFTLCRYVLPVSIAAFLLLPSGNNISSEMSNFFATFTYTLLEILSTLLLAGICRNQSASAVCLFGLERALRSASIFLGNLLWVQLADAGFTTSDMQLVTSVVAAFVIATTMLLMFDASFFSQWNNSSELISQEEHSSNKNGGLSVHAFAKKHSLTTREEEVLFLLLSERSYKDIENELVLSSNTVKTHVKNVYRKTKVHSREELRCDFEVYASK